MMRWLSVTACVALGAACAGAPPVPAQKFTDAEAEIKAAQEIGAENNPQASFICSRHVTSSTLRRS
jgi:hypothetical protein